MHINNSGIVHIIISLFLWLVDVSERAEGEKKEDVVVVIRYDYTIYIFILCCKFIIYFYFSLLLLLF